MKEEIWLYQLRYSGEVMLSVDRGGRNRVKIKLSPEAARHLAHRLMAFAASQHTTTELILTTKEQTNGTNP